jgi:hypothetical protein
MFNRTFFEARPLGTCPHEKARAKTDLEAAGTAAIVTPSNRFNHMLTSTCAAEVTTIYIHHLLFIDQTIRVQEPCASCFRSHFATDLQ